MSTIAKAPDVDQPTAVTPTAVTAPEAQVTGSLFTPAPHHSIQEFVPLVKHTDPNPCTLPPKRLSESISLSRLFFRIRNAIVNHVAPATAGTEAFDIERQLYKLEENVYDDPGPWHSYQKLDSDSEKDPSEEENSRSASTGPSEVKVETTKMSKKARIKSWICRKENNDLPVSNDVPSGEVQV
ncbi:hypothetical protein F5Y17DRAFT_359037 [Xylariaceae sp. FL0594]|nr:hypothetical protein F5Y17DRAFT_359037 [Xylariaceae sp. FL0594]